MGGIAAVAICAAFTSCSKSNELFDQNAAQQQKQQAVIEKKNADFNDVIETYVLNSLTRKFAHEVVHAQIWIMFDVD